VGLAKDLSRLRLAEFVWVFFGHLFIQSADLHLVIPNDSIEEPFRAAGSHYLEKPLWLDLESSEERGRTVP